MKTAKANSDFIKNIDYLIKSIEKTSENTINGIYLDESLTECFFLREEISVPAIPVKELDYATGYELVKKLVLLIPEFLSEHNILENRKPQSEQHSLQFIRSVTGKVIDFIHILRLDFKLSGGYGRITGKSDSRTFPEYSTDRIKYRSRLVPVNKGSNPYSLESLRLKMQYGVDTDGKRFTSVLFDEFTTSEISRELSVKAGEDFFPVPVKIYQFIAYDYFTACLNLLNPAGSIIQKASLVFEPLFLCLYYLYRGDPTGIDKDSLSLWDEYIDLTEDGLVPKPFLKQELKKFFSHYSLYRDEQLMLEGLRKISVN